MNDAPFSLLRSGSGSADLNAMESSVTVAVIVSFDVLAMLTVRCSWTPTSRFIEPAGVVWLSLFVVESRYFVVPAAYSTFWAESASGAATRTAAAKRAQGSFIYDSWENGKRRRFAPAIVRYTRIRPKGYPCRRATQVAAAWLRCAAHIQRKNQ